MQPKHAERVCSGSPAASQEEANLYLGVLFFSICAMLFNNWAEFAIITQRLPVFYKQVS